MIVDDSDRTVFIRDVPWRATAKEVCELFARNVGPVENVKLLPSHDGGHHRGCGFVRFCDHNYRNLALAEDGRLELGGRLIGVQPLRPKPQSVRPPRLARTEWW
jgi:RNA recognition motif-containing protein